MVASELVIFPRPDLTQPHYSPMSSSLSIYLPTLPLPCTALISVSEIIHTPVRSHALWFSIPSPFLRAAAGSSLLERALEFKIHGWQPRACLQSAFAHALRGTQACYSHFGVSGNMTCFLFYLWQSNLNPFVVLSRRSTWPTTPICRSLVVFPW